MPAVLVPGSRRLPQLVAQLGTVLILGLPADETRPVGEQRLVDDLDAAGGLLSSSWISYDVSSRASISSRSTSSAASGRG